MQNVLWIVIDAMRWDRVGFNGYHRPTTPSLDKLAASSVLFDQMISPHIPTHPAHTTLFSGADVFEHQIVAQGGHMRPPPNIRFLPEILAGHGYFTAAVDNIKLWLEPAFERYIPTDRWNHDGAVPWRNGEEVNRKAIDLLNEADSGGRPYFLFLHYWDPHTPYLPPPPFDRMFYTGDERNPSNRSMDQVWASPWFRHYFTEWIPGVTDIEFVKAQYDASIAYSDDCVGKILDYARSLDSWNDTLVIVHSDHGEELDDHGMWFDHHGLYETNIRVPFLMRLPHDARAGLRVPDSATLMDILPTTLAALNIPQDGHLSDGRDLLTVDRKSASLDAAYLTECTWMRKRGWRTDRWKLIEALEPDIYRGPVVELYDLSADPVEENNLAAISPEIVEALSSQMRAHIHKRRKKTRLPDPLEDQASALRIWQPRFVAGKA